MGILTRNADKESTKKAKMIKERKDAGIITNRKGKATQEKVKIQLEGIKKGSTGKKRILTR